MPSLRRFRQAVANPVLVTLALMAVLGMMPAVIAAPAPADQASEDSMTGHDGISKVEQRRLQHLFWAYNVIWLLLGIYLVSLGVRLRSVNRELARMQSRMQQPDAPSSSGH